jgi:hypothetical protein
MKFILSVALAHNVSGTTEEWILRNAAQSHYKSENHQNTFNK